MTLDVLYLTHNRRAFTEWSLAALIEHTNWDMVGHAWLVDDNSTDGTREHVSQARHDIPASALLVQGAVGGPVAAMNLVAQRSDADVIAKIDNDVIVCPRWLDIMAGVLEANPGIDALGMEPGFGFPYQPDIPAYTALPARWIGGVGLIRTRVFKRARLSQNERWFGWTQFQRQHVNAAWVTPDLPVFLLDHLPMEPFKSLAHEYVARGWSRAWPPYSPEMAERYAGAWLQAKGIAA